MDEPDAMHKIASITLADSAIIRRTPEVEHERAVAISDLLAANRFAPAQLPEGPYGVHLSIQENRLVMDVHRTEDEAQAIRIPVPLTPFRGVIKDYFLMCESYYSALKSPNPGKIEAIDMGRRGMHNDGAEMLQELLEDKITMDHATARRLFTLLCVLHIK